MIQDAIAYYHELLSSNHLHSTVNALESAKERLSVAGKPVCSVLRPFLMEADVYSKIMEASRFVMQGIVLLCRELMNYPALRKQLDLSDDEEAILRVETGYGLPDVSARLDGFLGADQNFKFVEYNSDSPGGIGYGDALGDLFASLPVTKEFERRYPYRTIPVRNRVLESLLGAYHRWGGKGLPAIAIIDWKEVPTRSEFVLFQEFFEKHGCRVKIGDPRDLEYRGGKLYLDDFHIELVYKRLVVGELLNRLGPNHILVQAARDRAVCVANGFGVQLAFRKILFALLSERVHSNVFDARIKNAIHDHIPWTRRVQECRTEYQNRTVDLIPFVQENQRHLVLKPSGEYGGKGVVLGWRVTSQEWEATIQHALANSFVVQERVSVGSEIFPSFENGELVFAERYFDLDPYVWNGEDIEGCGVRLSRSPLLNVSAGGGSATPLFILS